MNEQAEKLPSWFLWGVVIVSLAAGCCIAYSRAESPYSRIGRPTPAEGKPPLPTPSTSKPKQSILAIPGAAATAGPGKDSGAGTPRRTLRQQIKCVLYSKDDCPPCVKMQWDCEQQLPKLNWKLGTAKDFEEACHGEADFVFVHHDSDSGYAYKRYPVVIFYRNGMPARYFEGGLTATELSQIWTEIYNEQLEARAK